MARITNPRYRTFKHPTPNDFIRVAEKVSGLELDWFLTDWTMTTNTIDYGLKGIDGNTITLERIGMMPMPIDLAITYTDGTTEMLYIPLQMMRGEKPTSASIQKDWHGLTQLILLKLKKLCNLLKLILEV